MDEAPEALYNQWIKDRIEYYKRVEPVAAPRDEQLDLGPPVARIRVSHSNDRGPVGQLIWQSILSNRELANLQYIGRVADKHAKKSRSSGDATERLIVLKLTGFGLRLPMALPSLDLSLPYFGRLRFLGEERLPVALTPLLRSIAGQLGPCFTFQSASGDRPLVFLGKKIFAA